MSEIYSYKKLVGPLKRKGLLETEPVILSGDLRSGFHVIFSGKPLLFLFFFFLFTDLSHHISALYARIFRRLPRGTAIWSPVAHKKAEALGEYMMLFPEWQVRLIEFSLSLSLLWLTCSFSSLQLFFVCLSSDFVVFGDSGQGDVLLSELMMKRQGARAGLKASFIHNVKATSSSALRAASPAPEASVWVYGTSVGAAMQAFQLGLLSLSSLIEVAEQVVEG